MNKCNTYEFKFTTLEVYKHPDLSYILSIKIYSYQIYSNGAHDDRYRISIC